MTTADFIITALTVFLAATGGALTALQLEPADMLRWRAERREFTGIALHAGMTAIGVAIVVFPLLQLAWFLIRLAVA